MKAGFFKGLLICIVLIIAVGLISSMGYAQVDSSIYSMLGLPSFGVTSMPMLPVNFMGPWWATQVSPVSLSSSQWPMPIAAPFTGLTDLYGITGFSHIVPPYFGVSWSPGLGAVGGLGVNAYGSPNALMALDSWHMFPYFGVTSFSPGFYLGMYTPMWTTW